MIYGVSNRQNDISGPCVRKKLQNSQYVTKNPPKKGIKPTLLPATKKNHIIPLLCKKYNYEHA